MLYNSKRNKPLLLIYEIEATHEGEDLFAERAVSFVVHFPNDTAFKTIKVTYAINKVAQDYGEQLPLFGDEEDGDEARELNDEQEAS